MVVGVCGVRGETAPVPAAEVFNTLSAPVTTHYQRTEESTVRARGFSIVPATQRPALTPTVRQSLTVMKSLLPCVCM